MHSDRYFLQFSYLLYKQETLLLGLQNLLLQPACNAQHRQQKAANTSLLESRSLLQTATLVFPRPIVCSRLSNIINILAKKIVRPPTGGHGPPARAGSATASHALIFLRQIHRHSACTSGARPSVAGTLTLKQCSRVHQNTPLSFKKSKNFPSHIHA